MLGLDGSARLANLSVICQHTTAEDSQTFDKTKRFFTPKCPKRGTSSTGSLCGLLRSSVGFTELVLGSALSPGRFVNRNVLTNPSGSFRRRSQLFVPVRNQEVLYKGCTESSLQAIWPLQGGATHV